MKNIWKLYVFILLAISGAATAQTGKNVKAPTATSPKKTQASKTAAPKKTTQSAKASPATQASKSPKPATASTQTGKTATTPAGKGSGVNAAPGAGNNNLRTPLPQQKQGYTRQPAYKMTTTPETDHQVRVGIRAGGSYNQYSDTYRGSKWNKDHTQEWKASGNLRYYAGVMVNYSLNSKMAIQGEALFIKKGETQVNVDTDEKAWNMFNYIAVPILYQYKIIPKLYAEAGPEFSYAISKKFIRANSSSDLSSWSAFDIGISLGAGYFLTDKLVANVRFTPGIINVYKVSWFGDDKATNQNLQFGLNFFFD